MTMDIQSATTVSNCWIIGRSRNLSLKKCHYKKNQQISSFVLKRIPLDSKLNMLSSELCRSIISMDNHVSFVAIIDEKGRVKESQGNNNVIKKLLMLEKRCFLWKMLSYIE